MTNCAIYFDITTLIESRGPANGLLRVLRETAQIFTDGATGMAATAFVPCVFDQAAGRFHGLRNGRELLAARSAAVAPTRTISISTDVPTPPARQAPSRPIAASLINALPKRARQPAALMLRGARELAKEMVSASRAANDQPTGILPVLGPPIAFERGDVLVQAGAGWAAKGSLEELERAHRAGAKIITLICDLIPTLRPEFVSIEFAVAFTEWLKCTLRTSHAILAISHATKRDIEQVARDWASPCPPVSVLRLGDDGLPAPPTEVSAELRELTRRPYVVCLGTLEIRKNHRLLTHVWRRLAGQADLPRLVLVGGEGWLVSETTSVIERDLALKPNLRLVTGASDGEVAWLVAHAMFTVYPSFVEGWGLPVGECLAAGRIVVASNDPAVMEAGQGLAIHLAPDDVPAWTATVLQLMRDAEYRQQIERDIEARFKPHRWAETATDFAAALQGARDGTEPDATGMGAVLGSRSQGQSASVAEPRH